MTCALLLIHDGRRDYLEQTVASIDEMLPTFDQYVSVDDSSHALGFAGAIQRGWEQVETDWVAHVEADFIFRAPVDVAQILVLLKRHPEIAQVVLKRQPCNEQERAAGGVVECWPDEFTERREGMDVWTEHKLFWSTNPSFYSSRYCRMGWPQIARSEEAFTRQLLQDPHLRFAFWGEKFAPPIVEHIGMERAGNGY